MFELLLGAGADDEDDAVNIERFWDAVAAPGAAAEEEDMVDARTWGSLRSLLR